MKKQEEEYEDDDTLNGEERQRVLNELGLMSEADLALLYGCGVRSLKNRSRNDLPPFFRAGGKRLFFRADVVEYFRRRTSAD